MATQNRKGKHKRGIMASSNPTKVLLLGPAKVKHSYKTICAKFSVRVYMHIAELKLFDFCWAHTPFSRRYDAEWKNHVGQLLVGCQRRHWPVPSDCWLSNFGIPNRIVPAGPSQFVENKQQ